jgi:hypothetical protein
MAMAKLISATDSQSVAAVVGVHPNGKPLGNIPDENTKVLRRKLHAIVDPLWQNQTYHSRRKKAQRQRLRLLTENNRYDP